MAKKNIHFVTCGIIFASLSIAIISHLLVLPKGNTPQLSLLLSLPPILLVAIYFLVREKRTASYLNRQLDLLLSENPLTTSDVDFSTQSNGFMENLKMVLTLNQDCLLKLKEQKSTFETTSKVMQYKKMRLESVLGGHPDGVMVMDESSMVTYVNGKVGNLIGISKKEMVGKTFHEWAEDKELSQFLARYHGQRGRLLRVDKMEYTPVNTPNLTIMAGAYPLISDTEQQKPFGTLVVFRDITAEIMARHARGDFVSHISHELKSPLNVLSMYSETLLSDEGKNEDMRVEAANVIYDEVDRLKTLINNLLSISKIEMGSLGVNRQRIKPGELLLDAFEAVSRSGQETGIVFHSEIPPAMTPLSLDKSLFQIAVNNLLTNAVKYNRQGGKVSLVAKETEKKVMISVKDTGLGITEKDKIKIFDKFFRSEEDDVRKIQGHGIGLSLAKSIIELHNGKLTLKSTFGEGSTFTIEFDKTGGLTQEGI